MRLPKEWRCEPIKHFPEMRHYVHTLTGAELFYVEPLDPKKRAISWTAYHPNTDKPAVAAKTASEAIRLIFAPEPVDEIAA